eukprot:TRINITY_DN1284_c0_g3_i1.p1 TRINITY_DN1284_c0_g3~~TRINITY_DN1284_c0_g3_i1.p1  ORF type:complete len:630 (-),score=77.27 TRINITY_DN1284_c0_g3_i1:282-2171(-)
MVASKNRLFLLQIILATIDVPTALPSDDLESELAQASRTNVAQVPQPISLGSQLFPESENPYSADAPIPLFGKQCAEMTVIKNAELSSYGQVVRAQFFPPSCDWSQAVLRLDGAVKGVQFDRFGIVWLAGVEILRLTTPEPTMKGIRWQTHRDITSAAPILKRPSNMTLQIPNVVDKTYTGVIQVNVSIAFFAFGDAPSSVALPRLVRPLKDWTEPSIFSIGVNGNQTQNNTLTGLPRNMVHASLELFASGHGCEEFWYTNLPDKYTSAGGCGGGAYREIEVFVDGILAGVAYPFPVIYTGGVNPLLWRPLTGTASFDVPPYQFDLSPFLGLLNDGGAHEISLVVRHNNKAGVWYLDGVFHAELDPSLSNLSGELLHHSDVVPPTNVSVTQLGANGTMIITRGQRRLTLQGSLRDSQGSLLQMFSVVQVLDAFNNNTLVSPDLQISEGWMRSTSAESKPSVKSFVRSAWFPYFVSDESRQDKNTFQIGPTFVNYSRIESIEIQRVGEPVFHLSVAGGINATALYNRSLSNHSLVYKERSHSEEASTLLAGTRASTCFRKHLSADAGFTDSERETPEACDWRNTPLGLYACGLSFCRQLDGVGRSAMGFLPPQHRLQESQEPAALSTIFL